MNVKSIILYSLGILLVMLIEHLFHKRRNDELKMQQNEREKQWDNYQLLSHWLEIKNSGKSVATYFEEEGYKKIAIYGMGELANRLLEDLTGKSILVEYGIDRDVSITISQLKNVLSLNDELESVDAIVVTPFYAFDDIKLQLQKKVSCPIISLEEVIWSV